MSKLEGNERWKSKMLLTEHQEQYQKRNDRSQTGRPTTEELTLIRDSILLPIVLSVSEKNRTDIERSTHSLKTLFSRATVLLMDIVSKELFRVRRELKNNNIRVTEDEQIDGIMYYRFFCRGYEDKFGMVREVVRAEVSVKITRFINEVFKLFTETKENSVKT